MQMWITIAFQAHYIEAEKMRGRPLGAVGKYRQVHICKKTFFDFRSEKKMIFSFKNPAKISTAPNNMGWRGDKLLLQGKVKTGEFFLFFWRFFKEVGRVVVDAVVINST